MKFKLVDVKQEVEYGVQFGTCEFCFSVGNLEKTFYILEDENKNTYALENGYWCYDYFPLCYGEIQNVVDFASHLSKKEFLGEVVTNEKLSKWFFSILNEYVDNVQTQS